jgi:hypothetical protein
MGYEVAHRIYLAQYSEEWQAVLKTVVGCQFLCKTGGFFEYFIFAKRLASIKLVS